MPSGGDPGNRQAVLREDGSWLMDGLLHIDEVKERLQIEDFPADEQNVYETLGGFMMKMIGRIPTEADTVEWAGWAFEIVDMDLRRVDKVLARKLLPPAPNNKPNPPALMQK